jgi:tetratricopeptide (TPR) repeat protein
VKCRWIVLLALAVRGLFAFTFLRDPLSGVVPEDTEAYRVLAGALASFDLRHPAFAYLSPLYAFLLAPFVALSPEAQHVAVAALQIALDGASVALIHWLGVRLFTPAAARAASLIYALYGIGIYYSAVLLPVTVMVLLMLSTVAALLRSADRPAAHAAWPGACLALLALARPNAVVLLPLMLLWIAARGRARPEASSMRRGLWLVAGFLFVLSPFILRSAATGGGPAPFPANGGINLYIGNHADANGLYVSVPGVSDLPLEQVTTSIAEASRRSGRALDAREASRFWISQALDFARGAPRPALMLTLKKVAMFGRAEEIPLNIHYGFARQRLRLLQPTLTFGLLLPFALAGAAAVLVARERRRDPDVAFVLLAVPAYAASVVVFFVSDRYRIPVVPLLALLAGHGVWTLADRFRHRSVPWAALLALVTSAFVVNYPFEAFTYPEYAKDYYSLGQVLRRRGDVDGAAALYTKALELAPESKEVWVELATTRYFAGRTFDAETALRRALTEDPAYVPARRNLALLYREQGLFEDARRLAVDDEQRAAIDRTEQAFHDRVSQLRTFAESQYEGGVRAYGDGRLGEARYAFKRALGADPHLDSAAFALAMVAKDLRLKDEACAAATQAAALQPKDKEYAQERDVLCR